MSKVRVMGIHRRVGVAISVALFLLSLAGGLVLQQTDRVYQDAVDLADNWLPSVEILGDIRSAANSARKAQLQSLLEEDPKAKVAESVRHANRVAKVSSLLTQYETLICSEEDRQHFEAVRQKWAHYLTVDQKLEEVARAGQVDAARALATGESAVAFHQFAQESDRHIDFNRRGAGDASSAARYSHNTALVFAVLSIAFSFVLGVGATIFTCRSVAWIGVESDGTRDKATAKANMFASAARGDRTRLSESLVNVAMIASEARSMAHRGLTSSTPRIPG